MYNSNRKFEIEFAALEKVTKYNQEMNIIQINIPSFNQECEKMQVSEEGQIVQNNGV